MAESIWWIRRDFRIEDNPALNAAINTSREILPLFIIDENILKSMRHSERRTNFLFQGLRNLDVQLRGLGGRLMVKTGKPVEVLMNICKSKDIDVIFAEEDYSPYAQVRDQEVAKILPFQYAGSSTLVHPNKILKNDGTPYVVYTPFMKRWKEYYWENKEVEFHSPEQLQVPVGINSVELPTGGLSGNEEISTNSVAIWDRLNNFICGKDAPIYCYDELRDYPAVDGTSRISPYLKFGMVSVRQAVHMAMEAMERAGNENQRISAEKWLDEIIWREFYYYILYHYPHTVKCNFQSKFDSIKWENDQEDFQAWKDGQTGYPFIDAGMRQLNTTGWMHNRLRMVTASFLVKNLLIDWRWGELWFIQNLIDGDIASNVGGWQWVAGTGTDAAPYFRVFNPVTQSKKFDPTGEFIRTWLPELKHVPNKFIHTPWIMPASIQSEAGCIIGRDYPKPIVDLKFSRERVLSRYRV